MDPVILSSLAGALLSLLFSYIPGVSAWYAGLDKKPNPNHRSLNPKPATEYRRLVMLAALLLVAAGSFALSCAGLGDLTGLPLTCDRPGAIDLLRAFLAALVANQGVYAISPRTHP